MPPVHLRIHLSPDDLVAERGTSVNAGHRLSSIPSPSPYCPSTLAKAGSSDAVPAYFLHCSRSRQVGIAA